MIPIVYTAIDDAFTALFFGSGAWLGLLIFTVLIVGLVLAWKELVVVMLPIAILLGLEYLTHDLGWHGLIMFLLAIFVLFHAATKWKGGG